MLLPERHSCNFDSCFCGIMYSVCMFLSDPWSILFACCCLRGTHARWFYWIAIEQHWKSSQRRRNTYMYHRLFSMQLPERHSWNYTLSIFFCLSWPCRNVRKSSVFCIRFFYAKLIMCVTRHNDEFYLFVAIHGSAVAVLPD